MGFAFVIGFTANFTARDYTLQIALTHRLTFSVTSLGNGSCMTNDNSV
jgi:hypothetical protein